MQHARGNEMVTVSSGSGRLYRILDFTRVVQIFERKNLYFAHPSVWDDPYEQRIDHQSSHALFAQCWCQLGVSDAMWRIYSPNHMGVRIATTKAKLSKAIVAACKDQGYRWRGSPVEYLRNRDLEMRVQDITSSLKKKFSLDTAAKFLYMKREAFNHEAEWRATIYCPDLKRDQIQAGINISVDPHELIDNILLDPRAPKELIDAFTYYFEKKLKFKGKVSRSVLYKSPRRIQLVDGDVQA